MEPSKLARGLSVSVLSMLLACTAPGETSNVDGEIGGGAGGDTGGDEGGGTGGAGGSSPTGGRGGSPTPDAGQAGSSEGGRAAGGSAGAQGGMGSGGQGTASQGGAPAPIVVNPALIAYDGFSGPPAQINDDFFGIGKGSGKGWSTAWQQGENSGPGFFAIANSKPLTFGNLATSGNYMAHRNWDLGRLIDLTVPALSPLVSESQISKVGTVMWLSVLLRLEDAQNRFPVFVTLHKSNLGYHFYGDNTSWVAGVAPGQGVSTWSLWVDGNGNDAAPDVFESAADVKKSAHMSTKPMVIGKTHLLVISVEISGGNSDRISLYVDPPNLGGEAPAAPDATANTRQSAKFRAFAFSGGDGPQLSSFDEVRIGTSFAAVTPVN